MENKMTNVKAIGYVVENYGAKLPADVLEKLNKIKASYENKSTNKKPTANQKENAVLKDAIVEALTDEGITVSDLIKNTEALAGLSLPKVTALITQLVKEGKVERFTEKKKAFFRVVA